MQVERHTGPVMVLPFIVGFARCDGSFRRLEQIQALVESHAAGQAEFGTAILEGA